MPSPSRTCTRRAPPGRASTSSPPCSSTTFTRRSSPPVSLFARGTCRQRLQRRVRSGVSPRSQIRIFARTLTPTRTPCPAPRPFVPVSAVMFYVLLSEIVFAGHNPLDFTIPVRFGRRRHLCPGGYVPCPRLVRCALGSADQRGAPFAPPASLPLHAKVSDTPLLPRPLLPVRRPTAGTGSSRGACG
jgi:hypothetical protein